MPNNKSAAKRLRQSAVRSLRNRTRKSALWTWEKKFRDKVTDKEFGLAEEYLRKTISLYDKAAKVGIVHSNRADRKKLRLTKLYNEAKKAAGV